MPAWTIDQLTGAAIVKSVVVRFVAPTYEHEILTVAVPVPADPGIVHDHAVFVYFVPAGRV